MVSEEDVGKIVQAVSGSGLSGELLGFSDKGMALVKRPTGKWHTDPARVEVVPIQDPPLIETADEVLRKLCKIIMDEYSSTDSRYIYASEKMPRE